MKSHHLLSISTILLIAIGACKSGKSHLANNRSFGGSFGSTEIIKSRVAVNPDNEKENRQLSEPNKPANQESNQSFSKPARVKAKKIMPGARLFKNYRAPAGDTTIVKQRAAAPKIETNSLLAFIFAMAALFLLVTAIPALVLGIIGLIKYSRNPEQYAPGSKAFAIVGIVIGALAIFLLGMYILLILLWTF